MSRWSPHLVSHDSVHGAICIASETYRCSETVLHPFGPDFRLSSPRLEATPAREVHDFGGASSPMVRRWTPHFFLRVSEHSPPDSICETYHSREPILRPFRPVLLRSSPRFEAAPAREAHDSRGDSPPMRRRWAPHIYLCDCVCTTPISTCETHPHYSECRPTTCLLECLCALGSALPQGGREISSPIEHCSSLDRSPRVTSRYSVRRSTTCSTARRPWGHGALLGKGQKSSSPMGSSRFRIEIQHSGFESQLIADSV